MEELNKKTAKMSRYDLRKNQNSDRANDSIQPENQIVFENLGDPEYSPTLKDVMKLLMETHKTVSFLAHKFDELNAKMMLMEQQNKNITKENTEIKERLLHLETHYYRQQQQQLGAHLTIHGIPKKSDENIKNTIIEIGKILNINITQNNIKNARRMNSNNQNFTPIIVVEFDSYYIKQEIQKQYKNNGPILLKQIIPTTTNETTKVYINEYLTEYTKNLFTEAKKLKSKYNIQFVWIKNGTVYTREKTGEDIIKVVHSESIRQIKAKYHN